MPGGIFLIKEDGLVRMEESAYDSEELLQKLLVQKEGRCLTL